MNVISVSRLEKRSSDLEANEALNRSPLFNLIYNKISVGFSLLDFAEMLCQLSKPGAEVARNVAERVYAEVVVYVKELPDRNCRTVSGHPRCSISDGFAQRLTT
jgi:hypothetical protein